MKTKLFIIVTLFSMSLSSQVSWSVTYTDQPDLVEEISPIENNVIWSKEQTDTSFSISINGGKNWIKKDFPSDWSQGSIGALSALDENTAFLILSISSSDSQAGLYKTTDAGDTWIRESDIYNDENSFPNLVYFWNENEGFTMGDGFEIYYYNNGVWSASSLPTSEAFYSLNSGNYLRIVENTAYFTTNTSIFKSTDKGATWTEITIPTITDFDLSKLTFDFKDDSNGVLIYNDVSDTKVYVTFDGGSTWLVNSTTMFNNLSERTNKNVRYIPSLQMYLYIGYNGLFYSEDGISWTKNPFFDRKSAVGDLDYSSDGIYIGGFEGEIYFYSNDLIIPDENFEQALIDLGLDTTIDGLVTRDNIKEVTTLDVSSKNIADIRGIEGFTALETFACSLNSLTYIDISQNTALKIAYVNDNQLTNLDVSSNLALEQLVFDRNQISSIDVSQNTQLSGLSFSTNQITEIDLSQNALLESYLWVNENQLTELDLSNNPNLTTLHLENNHLTKLNIKSGGNENITQFFATENPNLTCIQVDNPTFATTNFTNIDAQTSFNLDCSFDSFITILDTNFEQALIDLGFDTNGLNGTILTSDAIEIDSLRIGNPLTNTLTPNVAGKITDISGIESMPNLKYLNVIKNEISSIDVSQNTKLETLYIYNNKLTDINVDNNTDLKILWIGDPNNREGVTETNKLTSINVSNNTLLEELQLGDLGLNS